MAFGFVLAAAAAAELRSVHKRKKNNFSKRRCSKMKSVHPQKGRLSGRGGSSGGGRAVGVAQHGVEGAGEVVGVGAAVVLLGERHQAGQHQQQQEEQLQREGGSQDAVEQRSPPLLGGRGLATPLHPGESQGQKSMLGSGGAEV